MRRNRATLLKYLIVICGFLLFQSFIRYMFEDDATKANGKLPSYIEKGDQRKQLARLFGGQLMWWEINDDGSPNQQVPDPKEVPLVSANSVTCLF